VIDGKARFLSLLAQAAVLASIPGPVHDQTTQTICNVAQAWGVGRENSGQSPVVSGQ